MSDEGVGLMMGLLGSMAIGFGGGGLVTIFLWLFTDSLTWVWPFGKCVLC